MKTAVVLLPVSILLSVGLMGVTRIRRKELDAQTQQRQFREIAMQVNIDLVAENSATITETQKQLEKIQSEIKTLTEQYNVVVARAEQAKTNWEDCSGEQKLFIDMIGESQTEFSNLKNSYAEEKKEWIKQADELTEQLKGRSPLCNFLKPGPHKGIQMCKGTPVAAAAPAAAANQKEQNPQLNAAKVKQAVQL